MQVQYNQTVGVQVDVSNIGGSPGTFALVTQIINQKTGQPAKTQFKPESGYALRWDGVKPGETKSTRLAAGPWQEAGTFDVFYQLTCLETTEVLEDRDVAAWVCSPAKLSMTRKGYLLSALQNAIGVGGSTTGNE